MLNDIEIVIAKYDLSDKYLENDIESMMPRKYEEALKYRTIKMQKTIKTEIILIKKYLNIDEKDIYYNKYKKPLHKNIFFNISHSNDYVALVKDDQQIGLDIQYIDKKNLDIINYAFTDSEIEYIKGDTLNRFFELWTKKEAVGKADGIGLSIGPKEIVIPKDSEINGLSFNKKKYFIKSTKFNNYFISVCSLKWFDNIILKEIL